MPYRFLGSGRYCKTNVGIPAVLHASSASMYMFGPTQEIGCQELGPCNTRIQTSYKGMVAPVCAQPRPRARAGVAGAVHIGGTWKGRMKSHTYISSLGWCCDTEVYLFGSVTSQSGHLHRLYILDDMTDRRLIASEKV